MYFYVPPQIPRITGENSSVRIAINILQCIGDGKGDACATDYDGDGIEDTIDVCPFNGKISKTMFFNAIEVGLDDNDNEQSPHWDYISVS